MFKFKFALSRDYPLQFFASHRLRWFIILETSRYLFILLMIRLCHIIFFFSLLLFCSVFFCVCQWVKTTTVKNDVKILYEPLNFLLMFFGVYFLKHKYLSKGTFFCCLSEKIRQTYVIDALWEMCLWSRNWAMWRARKKSIFIFLIAAWPAPIWKQSPVICAVIAILWSIYTSDFT